MFTASLSSSTLLASPGRVVACDLELTNGADVAQAVEFETVGAAAPWALVVPSQLELAPQSQGRARVTFAVPDSAAVGAGTVGFAVAVRTSGRTAELPGSLEIAETRDVRVMVTPLISRSRREGHHAAIVKNCGNVPARVGLEAVDGSGGLALAVAVPEVTVEPGEQAEVPVVVRGRRRRPGQHRRFSIVARSEGATTVTAEGVWYQDRPRVRWPAVAAAVAAVALTALVVWGGSAPNASHDEASAGLRGPNAVNAREPAAALASNCPQDVPAGVVVIQTFAFCPATTTVEVGAEVTWTNHDLAPHTATGSFGDTGSLAQGQSFTTRFDQPGTYPYYCRFHPGMRATVVVVA